MIEAIWGIFFFIFGSIVGSFLNVVALRFNTGFTFGGRSMCPMCNKILHTWELIPIVSFICLRGRCVECKSAISPQYPIVEALMGLIFSGLFLNGLPVAETIYAMLITSLLFVIVIYDIHHTIIPNPFVYTFIGATFITLFVDFETLSFFIPTYLDVATGPILFFPFFLLWFFSKGKLMGLGDGKLAAGIGFALGFSQGITALAISFWVGAIVSLALLFIGKVFQKRRLFLMGKPLTIKSEIPFAPFLVFGFFITYLFGIDLILLIW
jgi:leader peptidase (prepilin peptidase) / N-methyltransferase